MVAEIILPDEAVAQINAKARRVAQTAADASVMACSNVGETVRLHVVNALTEAVYNTVLLNANYLEERGLVEEAEALRAGASLRNQQVLSVSN